MPTVSDLKIKIFADGADHDSLMSLYAQPYIRGFTTNPTLMRKANIANYEEFAHKILARVKDRPVSFEVFADEFDEMEAQALTIANWGPNVNVKIPVSNTRREFAGNLIEKLCARGVVVNVTAVFTLAQVRQIARVLNPEIPAIVSVFAGRIADTGSRSCALDEGGALHSLPSPQGRTSLGQPARSAQHISSQRRRMPHHHRDL